MSSHPTKSSAAARHLRPLSLLAGLLFLVTVGEAKRLPDFIPTCKRNHPNFDKCVLDAIEVVRPYLKDGIPKIRVPSLEPLVIPQLSINRDNPNLKVKAELKNVKIWGAMKFKVLKMKSNLDKLSADVQVLVPSVYVTTDYDVDGRLLVVPLKGKGIFSGNFTNIVADGRATGELIDGKKGQKYVQVKTLKIKAKVGGQQYKFVNTDNNPQNTLITNTAAQFVNNNREQVLEIILPIVEETAEAIAKQFANNMLRTIPYNELVPDE